MACALAAAAKAQWMARLADPAVQNSWATNVQKVGKAGWADAMKNKGHPAIDHRYCESATGKLEITSHHVPAIGIVPSRSALIT